MSFTCPPAARSSNSSLCGVSGETDVAIWLPEWPTHRRRRCNKAVYIISGLGVFLLLACGTVIHLQARPARHSAITRRPVTERRLISSFSHPHPHEMVLRKASRPSLYKPWASSSIRQQGYSTSIGGLSHCGIFICLFPFAVVVFVIRQWRRSSSGHNPMAVALLAGRKGPPARHATELRAMIDPNAFADPSLAEPIIHHLQHAPFGVGVGLGCQVQKCGDELYRSTLDPVRRLEAVAVGWGALLPPFLAFFSYLFARPGVAYGLYDNLVLAPLHRRQMLKLQPKKIKVGKKLGAGGFGEVYLGTIVNEKTNQEERVVIKRADEFGEAETWMNERINRALPGVCAELLDSFEVKPTKDQKSSTIFGNTGKKELWLAFRYEGGQTVFDFMDDPKFPFNMEVPLFGEPLDGPLDINRKMLTIRELLREYAKSISAIHSIGIVHRDLKPQNSVVGDDGTLKIIDLGCAADLRSGINYIPQEYVMDPRYSAPELTVMNAATPAPPSMWVATFFAPALWVLNTPDRFDVYSLGIIFLQMVFPSLRPDPAIQAFNKKLASKFRYDLEAWREAEMQRKRKDYLEGFALLDLNDGAGWELLKQMLQYKSRDRPSAAEVLESPFIRGPLLTLASRWKVPLKQFLEAASDASDKFGVNRYMGRFSKDPMLTEAQLDEMLSEKPVIDTPGGFRTMAWWETRKRALTVVTVRRPPRKSMTFVDRLSDRLQDAIFKDRKF